MPGFSKFRVFLSSTVLVLLLIVVLPSRCRAQGFPPVTPEELKMTSEPKAPGAAAVILYREVDRDDNAHTSHEDNYIRIKVLTEEGRKFGDVEIEFDKADENVASIHARTIRPDGSAVEFDGKVFEKVITKAQGLKYLAKTFTLPDVQIGSIIEYRFTYDFTENLIFNSNWILSSDLFTKQAKFSLKPYEAQYYGGTMRLRWTWQGVPAGSGPTQGPDHIVRMEVQDVPAFQVEDFMPPPNEMKARVNFIYEEEYVETQPDQYWQHVGKKRNAALESFVNKRKAMEGAVAQIVSPSDPPEVKLRKIYQRVQQIRNTSYEIQKTTQEEKRDKEKFAENVEDVWKRGYGTGVQLTWLYLGLVQAAGFDACGVWVSNRRQYFFNPKSMERRKLDSNVVLVHLNGKDLYFDPGAEFTPYGLLTWSETGTPGLCLNKDGGTWIQTTFPQSADSHLDRVAKFTLTDSGDLKGKVTVTYTGLEAMYHRQDVRNADDVTRKKFLEDRLKNQIPLSAEVELTNKPDWKNPEAPLSAEFDVSIPGWASNAGRRILMPAGILTAIEKHLFEHTGRVQPIYMEYPYQKNDDVTIELPAGWQVGALPPPQVKDAHLLTYSFKVDKESATVLHITRKLTWDFLILEKKYYPALREFFQTVRTGDDQQIVLESAPASASN